MVGDSEKGMNPHERDRLVALEIRLESLSKSVSEDLAAIRKVTDALHAQSMYVRGALVLAVAVGGLVAWLGNVWSAFR